MKYLAVCLLLCSLVSVLNAQCFYMTLEQGATHCVDPTDSSWHSVGSTWTNSDCLECSCDRCCTLYSTPRSFPDDCVSVFDKAACKYRVHKRDDPSVQCPIYASVLK